MGEPAVIVMSGLPGVGKSTVSELLADRLGAKRFRSDVIRKELFDEPTYSAEERHRVYAELFSRAGDALSEGHPVVLDATFSRQETRDHAATLVSDVTYVHVDASDEVVKARLADRDDDPSDADFEVYLAAKQSFEPLTRAAIHIDNSGTLDETCDQLSDHH